MGRWCVTTRWKRALLGSAFACGLLALSPSAWSHAADEAVLPPGSVVIAPRTEARAGQFEMVSVFSHQIYAVFLSRYADGSPVTGATLEASTDLQSAKLTETDPGVYSTKELLMTSGKNDVTIKYHAGAVSGSVEVPLMMPAEAPAPAAPPPVFSLQRAWMVVGGVVIVYALVTAGFMLTRRRGIRPLGWARSHTA